MGDTIGARAGSAIVTGRKRCLLLTITRDAYRKHQKAWHVTHTAGAKRWCRRLVKHVAFETAVVIVIMASSVLLALDDPNKPDEARKHVPPIIS